MKNKLMQTIVRTFLGLLMLIIGTQTLVFGQENKTNGQQSSALVGVWRNTITLRNCQTGNQIATFQGLLTFHEGGTMSEFGGINPVLRSPGHGVWQASNPFHPTFAFTFLRFNADGTFAGTQRVRSTVSLGLDGNAFQSTGMAEVLDVNDNVVGMSCAATMATRFQ
jgi:hypothetical protein